METDLIKFLAKVDLPDLENRLLDPQDICLSKSGKNHIPEAKKRLAESPDIDWMLDLHLVTAVLLGKCHPQDFWEKHLEQLVDVEIYLPRSVWEKRAASQWRAVPVLLACNGEGYLRHFILGRVQGADGGVQWPEWSDPLMDDACKAAIVNAASLAARAVGFPPGEGVYCYPLIHCGCPPIAGGSLGLPLALGMAGLMSGTVPKSKILATGRLDANGKVLAVGSLPEKTKRVAEEATEAFRAFFYPSANDWREWVKNDGGLEPVPVSNFEQARMFEEFYGPGGRNRLALLSDALEKPGVFVNNCHNLDIPWLDWGDNRQKLRSLMEDMAQNPDLFEEFVKNIRQCSDHHQLELAERLLSLIHPSLVDEIESQSALTAFKLCNVALTIANHGGRVEAAKGWSERAKKIVDTSKPADIAEMADYYNHKFINDFHNSFKFQPDLPSEFQEFFKFMKSRYEEAARFAPVDENMGKLYGSIAQNYGFCGPEHLDAAIQSAKKAMRCFGGDQGPKSAAHQDRQRQLNYMIYAYLDAGQWEDAEKKLMDYLEIEALDAAYPLLNDNGMDKFHHAVLARFFADCGSNANCKRFFDIFYPKRQIANKDHPWQLWAFNLGRIAETIGRKTEAGELYQESLMICLLEPKDSMDQRTTIVTMALLPLSRLRRVGAISDDEAQRCIQRARDAAAYLNPKHFRTFLDESDVDNALALVCQHPETFFPFTYR